MHLTPAPAHKPCAFTLPSMPTTGAAGRQATAAPLLLTPDWEHKLTTQDLAGVFPTASMCGHLIACVCLWLLTHRLADYVPGSSIRLDNPFKHGVSAALMLLDLAVSRLPLISFHIQVSASSSALLQGGCCSA